MRYEVVLTSKAERDLAGLRRHAVYPRLLSAMRALRSEPRPHGVERLTGRPGWRIRIGNYRIIYEIDDVVRVVAVQELGHRRDVYRTH